MNILLGVIVMILCLVLQAGLAGAAIIFYDKRRAAILAGPVECVEPSSIPIATTTPAAAAAAIPTPPRCSTP